MKQIQFCFESVIGKIYLTACDQGLTGIYFSKKKFETLEVLNSADPAEKHLIEATEQLESYLSGKRKKFDLPVVVLSGTEFQKKVWKALSDIPYGKTISYKKLAENIKNPKAVRAVGSANGKNPLSILVPCHRVIAFTGKIGGYAGGLSIKEKLLQLESQNT